MVPIPTPQDIDDPLLVRAEPYWELPVQGTWQEPSLPVPEIKRVDAFENYVRRKSYVHNGGHALLAYHGYLRGLPFLWQAAEDAELATELTGFWQEANEYLVSKGMPLTELEAYEAGLLIRFQNHVLNDTIARVARDPARKLRLGDRLTTVAYLQIQQRRTSIYACRAIAAALLYDSPNDASAMQVQAQIRELGVQRAFQELSGIKSEQADKIGPLVEEAYRTMARQYGKLAAQQMR